jgi:hypothetical protein
MSSRIIAQCQDLQSAAAESCSRSIVLNKCRYASVSAFACAASGADIVQSVKLQGAILLLPCALMQLSRLAPLSKAGFEVGENGPVFSSQRLFVCC